MILKKVTILVSLIALGFLGACADDMMSTDQTTAAAKGGCKWDCPKCVPNKPCSKRPCIFVCPPNTVQCGDTFCHGGDVCCNESCGICTEPGGFCTEQFCLPDNGACTSDSDCRTYSNYCDGCACDALTIYEMDPICTGTIVQCFADPCMSQTAVCDQAKGQCVLAPIAP